MIICPATKFEAFTSKTTLTLRFRPSVLPCTYSGVPSPYLSAHTFVRPLQQYRQVRNFSPLFPFFFSPPKNQGCSVIAVSHIPMELILGLSGGRWMRTYMCLSLNDVCSVRERGSERRGYDNGQERKAEGESSVEKLASGDRV